MRSLALFVLLLALPASAEPAHGDGWVDYGGAYQGLQLERVGDTVHLAGLLKPTGSRQALLATLPEGMRPSGRLIFLTSRHTTPSRVDVLPDGRVLWVTGGTIPWQSLSGIAFPVGTTEPLALSSGYRAYAGEYAAPAVQIAGDEVRLTGLVRGATKTRSRIATLPAGACPTDTIAFSTSHHEGVATVEVAADCGVWFVSGIARRGWISLDGVAFTVGPASPLGDAGVHVSGGRVLFTGTTDASDGVAGRLPEGVAPTGQLIFFSASDAGGSRVDVKTDGTVTVSPPGAVTLGGISFLVPAPEPDPEPVAARPSSLFGEWGLAPDDERVQRATATSRPPPQGGKGGPTTAATTATTPPPRVRDAALAELKQAVAETKWTLTEDELIEQTGTVRRVWTCTWTETDDGLVMTGTTADGATRRALVRVDGDVLVLEPLDGADAIRLQRGS